jgi:DNA-nicking Smr family endonuclease
MITEPPPTPIPIDGTLDLHTFDPRDLKELLPEYLQECRKRGILEVRVVHGKGTGALRESVHALLRRLPYVRRFALAPPVLGHWGATLVVLEPVTEGL